MQSAPYYLSETQASRTITSVSSKTKRPSFSKMYKTHKHSIYSYVLFRVGRDSDVAEDIVSDIFLKAYKNYDRYNEEYAMTTWLYTIARNTLTDFYRKNRMTFDIEDVAVIDEVDPLFRLCSEQISLTEVEEAINKLPELQQICIKEQFWGGKTAKEVAEEHNITHAAARKQVSRGIASLRASLLSLVMIVGPITPLFI